MKECKYCGRQNHKSSYEERKNSCPAFDKKCDKCGRVGHFKKKCLSKKKEPETSEIAAKDNEVNVVRSVCIGEMA